MQSNATGLNKVYIATSLDGYIADSSGGIGFLDTFPIPEDADMGYDAFMEKIDALLMGRRTFETVLGFDIEWPYTKPVFVWSQKIQKIPDSLKSKVQLVSGNTSQILEKIHQQGFHNLYIDGGLVIQSFLRDDLIDEMIITTIPVLIGNGISLFGEVDQMLKFHCVYAKTFANGLCQNVYKRTR